MGATTGNEGRTPSLSEVQISLLEQAETEARQQKEITEDSPVVKVVTSVTKLGDPHPQYPTLKVSALNPDGSVAAYRPTIWFDWDDPRILYIKNRAGQFLKRHPSYKDASDGISGNPNPPKADTETLSVCLGQGR